MVDPQKSNSKVSRSLTEKIEKRLGPRSYSLDLRVHNPANLGYGGVDGINSAKALISLARVKGIDIMAVSDLYTAEFIDRVQAVRRERDVTIIPGVDIRCQIGACDDILLSCLFPEHFNSGNILDFLGSLDVPLSIVRSQTGKERFLVTKSISEILSIVEGIGGAVLPIRLDKTPLRAQAIPELVDRFGFRSFDLAYGESATFFSKRWPQESFQLFNFSNAYALAQVGDRCSRVKLSQGGFQGVKALLSRKVDDLSDKDEKRVSDLSKLST